jgi:hypothetical protein
MEKEKEKGNFIGNYDVQCCILDMIKSDCSYTCKDFGDLRLVCKSFQESFTFQNLQERILETKLLSIIRYMTKDRGGGGHRFQLPIFSIEMIVHVKVTSKANTYIPRFIGPLKKELTPKSVLNMILRTLSGLYNFETLHEIADHRVYINLPRWEISWPYRIAQPLYVHHEFVICRPFTPCVDGKYGLLYGSRDSSLDEDYM